MGIDIITPSLFFCNLFNINKSFHIGRYRTTYMQIQIYLISANQYIGRALVFFVWNILNHIKLQWAAPLLGWGLLLLLILLLTSSVSSALFPAVGGLWVFKWWSPTHLSRLCATTQRNTRSSPAALTERCVLVLFILLVLSVSECILRQSKSELMLTWSNIM